MKYKKYTHHLTYFPNIFKNCSLSKFADPICVIKGCSNNCFADHRAAGSFFKQFDTKFDNLSEKPTTCGGYSLAILYIAFNGCNLKYGG